MVHHSRGFIWTKPWRELMSYCSLVLQRHRKREAKGNLGASDVGHQKSPPQKRSNNLLSPSCNNNPEFKTQTHRWGRERKDECVRATRRYGKTKRRRIQSILWSSCQSQTPSTWSCRVWMFYLFIQARNHRQEVRQQRGQALVTARANG